ncbi:MAG: hypothetical protein ACRD3G_18060 [Vicinamibacterales bacterium]
MRLLRQVQRVQGVQRVQDDSLSEAIEATDSTLYTTQFARAGRSNRILLDYLRNNRTNTSVAAYSSRARAGAPVSVPIGWDELRATVNPAEAHAATASCSPGAVNPGIASAKNLVKAAYG